MVSTRGRDWGLWRSWLLKLWANSIDLWNQSWELELLETPCDTSIKLDRFAFLVVTYVASVHPISRNRAESCLVNLVCQWTTNCSPASVNGDIILVLVLCERERDSRLTSLNLSFFISWLVSLHLMIFLVFWFFFCIYFFLPPSCQFVPLLTKRHHAHVYLFAVVPVHEFVSDIMAVAQVFLVTKWQGRVCNNKSGPMIVGTSNSWGNSRL